MSSLVVGSIGIFLLLVLLFMGMPVGFSMAFLGFAGFCYVVNVGAALNLLAKDFWEVFSSYGLTVVPLFTFMGQIAFQSGISSRLYESAYIFTGHRRGGMAIATVAACAGFSAVSGSTNATAATMASVALPEMKRYKYDVGLATGTVAASGSLGILIPPSVVFIIYGILTEQSIGKLFAAGILPGLLLSVLFILAIYIRVCINPDLAPPGPKTSFQQKIKSFSGTVETVALFCLVIGGIFWGIFTPTEAGAVGALLALIIAWMRGYLSWAKFLSAVEGTTRISCMALVIVTGAVIFGHFLAITRVPFELASWVSGLPLPGWAIMALIIFIFLIGGCFMDSLAMMMLTLPIFFPVSQSLGYDPIWFGVIMVLVCEIGVVTPPVGLNIYVVYGIAEDVPLETIFRGVLPMVLALVLCTVLLMIFPQIALILPQLIH